MNLPIPPAPEQALPNAPNSRSLFDLFRSLSGLFASTAPEQPPRQRLLQLFALSGLAVAQPLYDRLARRPEFFELEGIHLPGLIGLVLVLSVALPAFLFLLELLFNRCNQSVRILVHDSLILLLGFLFSLVLAQNLASSFFSPLILLLLALASSLLFLLIYRRSPLCRRLLGYAAWGSLLFPLAFLHERTLGNPVLSMASIHQRQIPIARPTPIVLLVFDEISGLSLWNKHRNLDPKLVPNFAQFARDAVWYRNATSVHPRTGQDIPAILTGSTPHPKLTPKIQHYPENLFTWLIGSRQYRITALEPYSALYPPEFDQERKKIPSPFNQLNRGLQTLIPLYAHIALPRIFDLPQLPKSWFGLRPDGTEIVTRHYGKLAFNWNSLRKNQMDLFVETIAQHSPSTVPCFFQHLVLPHIGWCYFPNGSSYITDFGNEFHPLGGLGETREIWCGDPQALDFARFRYRLQLALADQHVGRVLDQLKASGLYEQSLIIVMGDHGVSFEPNRSRRALEPGLYEDILSVPLLVKYPDSLPNPPSPGTINDDNVEIIDILPTIAETIGMRLPTPFSGRSLLSQPPAPIKRFMDDAGHTLDLPPDFIARLPEQPLRWQLPIDDNQSFPRDFFPQGPHPELIDKPLTELTLGPPSDLSFTADQLIINPPSDPKSPVPGYVCGLMTDRAGNAQPAVVAIAVNGTVLSTARTIQGLDVVGHLATLLSPDHFNHSPNKLRIFQIEPPSQDKPLTLRECAISASTPGSSTTPTQ